MKKILAISICFIIALPCFAQRDVKTLNKIGRQKVIQILGAPIRTSSWEGADILEYPDATRFCFDENSWELVGFNINSAKYCVFSDYVKGGFKVGDKFSKVQKFDFVHSKYGKNRPENSLKLIDSKAERDYYVVYSEEWHFFFFRVKNGIIIGIDMGTSEEYNGQDMTNKLW